MNGNGDEGKQIQKVVLDTTVLSNYAASESVEFIVKTFSKPITVKAVFEELKDGISEGRPYIQQALPYLEAGTGQKATETIYVRHTSPRTTTEGIQQLDYGEREGLACARYYGYALATDDMEAREVASDYNIPVTGSLGILIRGIERKEITLEEAEEWHNIWIRENGYYSPVDRVSELL